VPGCGRTTRTIKPRLVANQLDLGILHQQSKLSDPMGETFDYATEFKSLDLDAVVKDLHALMTD
jgi:catalase-peroxidase